MSETAGECVFVVQQGARGDMLQECLNALLTALMRLEFGPVDTRIETINVFNACVVRGLAHMSFVHDISFSGTPAVCVEMVMVVGMPPIKFTTVHRELHSTLKAMCDSGMMDSVKTIKFKSSWSNLCGTNCSTVSIHVAAAGEDQCSGVHVVHEQALVASASAQQTTVVVGSPVGSVSEMDRRTAHEMRLLIAPSCEPGTKWWAAHTLQCNLEVVQRMCRECVWRQ